MTSEIAVRIRALDADLEARNLAHREQKKRLLEELLAELGNVSECCRQLGITRQRWYAMVEQYHLPRSPYDFASAEHLWRSNPDKNAKNSGSEQAPRIFRPYT